MLLIVKLARILFGAYTYKYYIIRGRFGCAGSTIQQQQKTTATAIRQNNVRKITYEVAFIYYSHEINLNYV